MVNQYKKLDLTSKEIILAFRKYARYGFHRRNVNIFEMLKIVEGMTSDNTEVLK